MIKLRLCILEGDCGWENWGLPAPQAGSPRPRQRTASSALLLSPPRIETLSYVSLGSVAMKASSPARSSSAKACSNSCSRRFFLMAFSQQESRAQRYAPRPDFLPVASIMTCPSGVRTTRSNSRFGLVSRQEMQVRKGICLDRLRCFVAVLAIALLPIFVITI